MATIEQSFEFFNDSVEGSFNILAQNFEIVITGTPDATTDLYPVASSVRLIRNNGTLSYITLVLNGDVSLLDALNARPNGEIVVNSLLITKYGSISREIFRGNFDSYTYTKGPQSFSATVRGSETFTNTAPVTVNFDGPVYDLELNTYGERVFITDHNLSIYAGDSIIYNSETIEIRKIELSITPRLLTQSLTESIP